jgi:predicted negative regulator of RcsB-dependent stress response
MAYDLQEQEQLASMKAWWEKYGNFVLTVATLVFGAIAAYYAWQTYQRKQGEAATVVYEQLLSAVQAKDAAKTKELTGLLVEKHARTAQAAMAALLAAKMNADVGDAAAAQAQLKWVIEKSGHEEFGWIARVRLAGLQLDAKAYDDALKTLDGAVPEAQITSVADRRGDVFVAQNKLDDARKAYQQAIERTGADNPLRQIIQLKLDALPAATAS